MNWKIVIYPLICLVCLALKCNERGMKGDIFLRQTSENLDVLLDGVEKSKIKVKSAKGDSVTLSKVWLTVYNKSSKPICFKTDFSDSSMLLLQILGIKKGEDWADLILDFPESSTRCISPQNKCRMFFEHDLNDVDSLKIMFNAIINQKELVFSKFYKIIR